MTTTININTDNTIKEKAQSIFADSGLDISTAVNLFLSQTVRQKKIPFEIALDTENEKSVSLFEAMQASEQIWENAVRTNTAEMTLGDINAEIQAARAERKQRKA